MSQSSIVKSLTGSIGTPMSLTNRALAQVATEEITGAVGTTVKLAHTASSVATVVKNGTHLRPSTDFTIRGNTLTLTVAAIAGDWFHLLYWFTS